MIKNNKKLSLCVMVPFMVVSGNVTVNALVGVRSFGNSIIGVASKLINDKSSLKNLFTSKQKSSSVDHNKIAKSIDLYNNDKSKFFHHLIETPREIPLKEALELVKTPKISLRGYYYIKDENSFYPIVEVDNTIPSGYKTPKGVMTQDGFKGKEYKNNGMFEVVKVKSRKDINLKNIEGTDEKYEYVSKVISQNLKNISSADNIGDYDENEKGLLRLAAQYSKEVLKMDLEKPEDFMANDKVAHRNAFTLFSASFANDNDLEFKNWLRENYIYVTPDVKRNLKLINQKLIVTPLKQSYDTKKLQSISEKSAEIKKEEAVSMPMLNQNSSGNIEDYERQGAKPKTIQTKVSQENVNTETSQDVAEGEKFIISKDALNKSLKVNSDVIKNIDKEKEYDEKVEFYKKGFFKVPKSDSYIERDVYRRTYEKDREMVEDFFVKQGDNEVRVLETNPSSRLFSYILSDEESDIYKSIETKIIIQAVNKWGVNKQIIPYKVEHDDGTEEVLAYQVMDKLWRKVILAADGNYYLGDVVKYDNILYNVAGKFRKLAKVYSRYVSPVVSGVGSASKAVSGILD